jgi:hypothetical protein
MVKARMTTADVAAEVKCLRRLIGMRLANVYDITPKVLSPSRPFPHSCPTPSRGLSSRGEALGAAPAQRGAGLVCEPNRTGKRGPALGRPVPPS